MEDKNEKKTEKILAALMAIILCASATDVHVLAEGYNAAEKQQETVIADPVSAEDFVSVENTQNNWDGITTESVYETENYRV